MLQVESFVFNPFEENTYVLFDDTGECIIIDPGCYEAGERYELESFINDSKLAVKQVINTHCHVDHVLGNSFVKERYKVKLLIPVLEEQVLRAVKVYAPGYGLHQYQDATPDAFLEEGHTISFGKQSLDILFVPGHSPGHMAFYSKADNVLIGGDVLFYNSIGRTDLPGGNHQTLISSIHEKLFTLPDETIVYPGHGPTTTIGFEKRTNPFCAIVRA